MPEITGAFQSHHCSQLVDTAIHQMRDMQGLHLFYEIFYRMERQMRDMSCPQFSEVSAGPQTDDKARLNAMLLEKTLTAIETAPSGCMVDQALRDLRHFQSKLCTRITDEQRSLLIDAVDARTKTGMAETDPAGPYHEMWQGWRESCLHSLGQRPAVSAPIPVQEIALSIAA